MGSERLHFASIQLDWFFEHPPKLVDQETLDPVHWVRPVHAFGLATARPGIGCGRPNQEMADDLHTLPSPRSLATSMESWGTQRETGENSAPLDVGLFHLDVTQ
jgi:hypothetical protein